MNYFTWEVVTVDLDPERVKYKCNIVKGGNCCDKSIKGIARSNQLLTHLQNNHPSVRNINGRPKKTEDQGKQLTTSTRFLTSSSATSTSRVRYGGWVLLEEYPSD